MWNCHSCGTNNGPKDPHCVGCGDKKRPRRIAEPARPPIAAHAVPAAATILTPRTRPTAMTAVRPSPIVPPSTRPPAARVRNRSTLWTLLAFGLIGCLLLGFIGWGITELAGKATAGTTSGTAPPPSGADSADGQARSIAALIEDSSQSRSSVKDAVVRSKACENLAGNA